MSDDLYNLGDLRHLQTDLYIWGRTTFGPSTALAIATRMNVEMAELLSALIEASPALEHSALALAVQANVAAAEALNAVRNQDPRYDVRIPRGAPGITKAATGVADVTIMALQVSAALGDYLGGRVLTKFEKLRTRRWQKLPSGQHQHVPDATLAPAPRGSEGDAYGGKRFDELPEDANLSNSFINPGTGLQMRDNLWYLISDSGSAYPSSGFTSPEVIPSSGFTSPEVIRGYVKLPYFVAKYGGAFELVEPEWDAESASWKDPGLDIGSIVKGEHLRLFWLTADPEHFYDINPGLRPKDPTL